VKVCLLGDVHFGMRGDSISFLDYGEKFYTETFFPYLINNNIKTIIQLGDFFDRRKYINFYSLKRTKEMFLNKLNEYNIKMFVLAGNHDTYHKNTNNINSLDLLLQEYCNITIIDKPDNYYLGEKNSNPPMFCIIPWICADNYEETMEIIKNTKANICIGHFEISGFSMHAGQKSEEGLDKKIFGKFDKVFSGHYHHRSTQENITYVGTPMEMTWQDYNDQKGFHLFDTDTYDLEFIPNPNIMFHRITYDDKKDSITEITSKDLTMYTNTYVKVVVINKTNPFLFDKFMENIYNVNPIDVTIVEDHTDLTEGVEDDTIDQAQDTMTIIEHFVDGIKEEHINNDKLKTVMKELYVEALNLEQA
jgi:DNA repair exonuclease SbcCD nuclease subunit